MLAKQGMLLDLCRLKH